ncbi:hypothetical protein EDD85DRAFT_783361 [Armillaria nabsnona]|nr:hypothetical protein EDD85DRAFT_783361 [Armillaria nabsnona]
MERKDLKESLISKKDIYYGKKTYPAPVFICKTLPYIPPHTVVTVTIVIELLDGKTRQEACEEESLICRYPESKESMATKEAENENSSLKSVIVVVSRLASSPFSEICRQCPAELSITQAHSVGSIDDMFRVDIAAGSMDYGVMDGETEPLHLPEQRANILQGNWSPQPLLGIYVFKAAGANANARLPACREDLVTSIVNLWKIHNDLIASHDCSSSPSISIPLWLVVDGEKRDIGPFVVRLNDGVHICKGVTASATSVNHFTHVHLPEWSLLGRVGDKPLTRDDFLVIILFPMGIPPRPVISFRTQQIPIFTAGLCH